MSATPGKILVNGICEIDGERLFVLKCIQGRNPDWVNRIFFAKYDENASWLDQLRPAFGKQFFFEEELQEMMMEKRRLASLKERVVDRELNIGSYPN